MTILATIPGYFSYFAALPLIFFFRTSTYPIFEVNSAAIYIRSIIPCIARRRLEFSSPGISVKKNPEVTSHRFQVITHSASDHFQLVGWHIPTGLLSVQNNETILLIPTALSRVKFCHVSIVWSSFEVGSAMYCEIRRARQMLLRCANKMRVSGLVNLLLRV